MKIVLVHNFYQQPGGEDQVFADEAALLESRGHTVVRHTAQSGILIGAPLPCRSSRLAMNAPASA